MGGGHTAIGFRNPANVQEYVLHAVRVNALEFPGWFINSFPYFRPINNSDEV
jgi:hypothetical protein